MLKNWFFSIVGLCSTNYFAVTFCSFILILKKLQLFREGKNNKIHNFMEDNRNTEYFHLSDLEYCVQGFYDISKRAVYKKDFLTYTA